MTCEPDLLESYTKDILSLVEYFSETNTAGKQSLTQLLTSDAHTFCAASIQVLARAAASAGTRFLTHLLTKEKLLTAGLLDAGTCNLKDAMAAAKAMDEMGFHLQPALEMALSRILQTRVTVENAAQVMRILDILGAVPTQNTWPSFQNELMAHPDKAVRSKAALLIGRGLKNPSWISRRMMDKDARVQANAVEALWSMDAAESRPVFNAALRSQNNRVVANAALGLYRLSDLRAVRILLDLAQHSDPLFRASALWAIAQTEDPRFIPFLMEQFKLSEGKVKLAVTRSLARIRRREKASADKGTIQIRVPGSKVRSDGSRYLDLSLSLAGGGEITTLKPTEFSLWEGGALIEDYEVKLPNNPAALVIGILAPRFLSNTDPYGNAVAECLQRCLALKRPDDWWRIDRYAIEEVVPDPNAPPEKSTLPYDDALVTQDLKTRKGFAADAGVLEKVLSTPVPRERAMLDLLKTISRPIDGMDKSSGKRHLFVFVHSTGIEALDDPENLKPLKQLVAKESVTLHGFCPVASEKCPGFRDLCLFTSDGTFQNAGVDQLVDELEQTYRQLLNRYEIKYSQPAKAEPSQVTLQICSEYGVGRVEFSMTAPTAQQP